MSYQFTPINLPKYQSLTKTWHISSYWMVSPNGAMLVWGMYTYQSTASFLAGSNSPVSMDLWASLWKHCTCLRISQFQSTLKHTLRCILFRFWNLVDEREKQISWLFRDYSSLLSECIGTQSVFIVSWYLLHYSSSLI